MSDEAIGTPAPRSQIAKLMPNALKSKAQLDEIRELKEPDVTRAPVSARGSIVTGLVIVLVTFFGAGVWAATAPLASAVAAPGTVIFAGKRRAIQHLEGGIIAKLHVREGQEVQAGDVLLTLDETQARATVNRLRTQLDTQLALEARLSGEQSGVKAVEFPPELLDRASDEKVAEILAGQRQEFDERQKTLVGTVDLLNQKITQLGQTIDGLTLRKTRRSSRSS